MTDYVITDMKTDKELYGPASDELVRKHFRDYDHFPYDPAIIRARHTATGHELAVAIADTCREIEEAMVAGDVPRSVRSFGELHDYCDANCLAGCCDDDNPRAWWTVASYNALQDAVDARLAAGEFDSPVSI